MLASTLRRFLFAVAGALLCASAIVEAARTGPAAEGLPEGDGICLGCHGAGGLSKRLPSGDDLVAHRRRGHVRAVGARADRLRRLPRRGQASCTSGQRNGLRQRTRACAGAERQLPRLPRPGVQGLRRQQPRDAAARRQPRGARLRRLPPTAPGHAGIGAGRADERLHRRATATPPNSTSSGCPTPPATSGPSPARPATHPTRCAGWTCGSSSAPAPLQDRDGALQFEQRARAADVNHDGLDANELRAPARRSRSAAAKRFRCAVGSSFGPASRRTNCPARHARSGSAPAAMIRARCRSSTSPSRSSTRTAGPCATTPTEAS